MLKDQKGSTLDILKHTTPPPTPSSPSTYHAQPFNSSPSHQIPAEATPPSAPQFSSIVQNQIRTNLEGPLLNTLDNYRGNPSAAAALVMMNAILASQQNQVRKYAFCIWFFMYFFPIMMSSISNNDEYFRRF